MHALNILKLTKLKDIGSVYIPSYFPPIKHSYDFVEKSSSEATTKCYLIGNDIDSKFSLLTHAVNNTVDASLCDHCSAESNLVY